MPTLAESGLDGFDAGSWISVHVPAGTPPEAVTRLHGAIRDLLVSAEGREWMAQKGYEAVGSSPAEARAYAIAEQAAWARLIREAGIEAQ